MNTPAEEFAVRVMEGTELEAQLKRRGITLSADQELNRAIQAYACAFARHAVAIAYDVQAKKG
ncbi:hypothetical protein [Micromonospora sp. NPDC023737]|uniref:hypothetical protein n=1 Tax=unclassified Micromonospora TaxID=2617518 RepID=UPI0033C6742F